MNKDDLIKNKLSEYFDGVNPPSAVTENAKQIVYSNKGKGRLRKLFYGLIPALASFVLIAVGVVGYINATKINYYSGEALNETQAFYSELKQSQYATAVRPFEQLEKSDKAHIDYFAYYDDGGNLMYIRLDIIELTASGREDVTVYIEYTDKKNTCESFKEYYSLDNEAKSRGNTYQYESVHENGEWVSKAYLKANGVKYFIDSESSSANISQNHTIQKYANLIF